jgi:drug/metabolite transporter (DMT)-like permease
MRRAVPWIDLAIGVAAPGAGLVLLAVGVADEGPLAFMGWRSLLLAVPGVLLARPTATAWRDALPGGAVAVFALGMLGYALETSDVATVAVVTVGVALGSAPLVSAVSCPRWPSLLESVGALLVASGLVLLGTTEGFPPGMWLAAAAGLGFAGVVVLTDRVLDDHPAPSVVMPQVLIAGVALVVAGGLLEDAWLPSTDVFPVLVAAGLATGLAPMLARWRGAEVLGPAMARKALPFEIVVGVVAGTWSGGPTPTTGLWAAAALATIGAIVVAWQPGRLAETELFSVGR